jgi:hypothetical protein
MRFITEGEVFVLTPVFAVPPADHRPRTSVDVSEIDCLAGVSLRVPSGAASPCGRQKLAAATEQPTDNAA